MDLEEEFQKLMQGVVDQIQDRVTKGNLSAFDGADLIRMVRERTATDMQEAWSSSTQSCMDSYNYDQDADYAWNRSGQSC